MLFFSSGIGKILNSNPMTVTLNPNNTTFKSNKFNGKKKAKVAAQRREYCQDYVLKLCYGTIENGLQN